MEYAFNFDKDIDKAVLKLKHFVSFLQTFSKYFGIGFRKTFIAKFNVIR